MNGIIIRHRMLLIFQNMNENAPHDLDFEAKLAKSTYKTTYSAIGSLPKKSNLPPI